MPPPSGWHTSNYPSDPATYFPKNVASYNTGYYASPYNQWSVPNFPIASGLNVPVQPSMNYGTAGLQPHHASSLPATSFANPGYTWNYYPGTPQNFNFNPYYHRNTRVRGGRYYRGRGGGRGARSLGFAGSYEFQGVIININIVKKKLYYISNFAKLKFIN